MGKFKKRSNPQIKTPDEDNPILNYPVFCFKHLQTKPKNPKDKPEFYAEFIERLKKISSLTWSTITGTYRHGFGIEKIPIHKIKPQLPAFITPDVTDLTVFRATGDNRPFLGIRKGNVFHIIFIEESFDLVYDH
jgi:hypothetical protein